MLTSFASHLTAAMNRISATSFMGPMKTFYCQEIENGCVHTKGKLSLSTKLVNYLEMYTSELQQLDSG
jgi:hypothetical protein